MRDCSRQFGSMLTKNTRRQSEAGHKCIREMAMAAKTCQQPYGEQIMPCLAQQKPCPPQPGFQKVLRRRRSEGCAEGNQKLIGLQRYKRREVGKP
jgi:hypothetical protein